MADEQLTQEQLLEQQKQNCIFCKIISGEITSKKVYEDDQFLAVLDINPAAPGHVILMPKEHIPILAVLPEERMNALFSMASKLAAAVQDAMIAQRITIFCPSGYAAGQRPPYHLLLHIIPREKGDGLDMLDLEKSDVAQADAIALTPLIEESMRQVLLHVGRDDLLKKHHLHKKHPAEGADVENAPIAQPAVAPGTTTLSPMMQPVQSAQPAAVASPVTSPQRSDDAAPDTIEFSTPSAALEHVLAMSPDLRNFIMMQPELVTDYIKKSPKLSKLFEGVDIAALSHMLRQQQVHEDLSDNTAQAPPQTQASSHAEVPSSSGATSSSSSSSSSSGEQLQSASDMSEQELFNFIDGNAGLRQWLLEHPKEFAQNIGKNPRLQAFFDGINIIDLSKKYRDYILKGGGR